MSWRDRVRSGLRELSPYHVPPLAAEVKLDANESPFAPPPELLAALAEAVRTAPLHRYPDPRAARLRALIADDLGEPAERLVLGNGADELIALLCGTFAEPHPGRARAALVYPSPGFVVFRTAALGAGMEVVEAPLGPRFEPDLAALETAILDGRPNLVLLATPNNPTGTVWPRDLVDRVVAGHPEVVFVIDHAYVAYGGEDLSDLARRHAHVAVLRTYSKLGLAGLRVGVLVAPPPLAHEVEKIRPPYNLGVLPQLAAELALGPFRDALRRHVVEVVAERERLHAALARLPGVEVFPSGANLLLLRVARAPAVWQGLVDRSVLVRNLDRSAGPGAGRPGPLSGCLRVTVGTPDENRRFLTALAEVLAA